MIKIGDMLEQPEIQKMKRESIYALSKEKNIQEFLKTYHLNTSIMDDYWVEFLDYNDDYQLCQGCQSLQNCRKDNQGMKKNLVYRDGEVILELESCLYGKALERRRLLLEKFVITNVNDDILLTDLTSLEIVKKANSLSPNGQNTLGHILKYLQEPNDKGLFLHGEMGTGKTTLSLGSCKYFKIGRAHV